MSKGNENVTSLYQIKSEVNRLVKIGMKKGDIRSSIISRITPGSIDINEAESLIVKYIQDHPNYDLIQNLNKSILAMDKSSKDSSIYYFNLEDRLEDIIDKSRLLSIYPKFDFSSRVHICNFTYDPFSKNKLYKSGKAWNYNIYKPPFWQDAYFYMGEEIGTGELPDIYHRFFLHFTDGDNRSYEYVLDWMANALRGRNYCMLTAIGNQGVGKGVLGNILMGLFGEDNYTDTQRITKSNFNAQVLNKRCIFVDELKLSDENEENKLKVLINDYIEIEKKGIDAERHKNYASIYIASNSLDAIPLRGDDRRFSIVTLSNDKLIGKFTIEEINSMFDKDNISMLAKYLWNRVYNRQDMMRVFITERTESIRRASLNEWQELFLDEFCIKYAGQTISCSDISDMIIDKLGTKYRVSKKAMIKFNLMYPEVFNISKVYVDDSKIRKWCVVFAPEENK